MPRKTVSEKPHTGRTKNALYRTWSGIIARCEFPGASNYKNYGGRGISVCDRWRNSFEDFINDMGPRPKGMSIDRYPNNDGNYEPGNCRWATLSQQARNTRKARIVEIDGVSYHVAELEEKYGIDMRTLVYRIKKGWPAEKIFSSAAQYNNSESQKKAVAKHAELKRAETHCKRGHEFTPENTYVHKGHRMCRACRKAYDRFLYYKKTRPLEEFL